MDRIRKAPLALFGLSLALMLVAAGCAKKNNPSSGGSASGGDSTFSITAPAANASVAEPFTLTIHSNAALGDPSTGNDHVHLCFDNTSCDTGYTVVTTDSVPVTALSPGQHTITVSLRNADHSPVGPTETITVNVTGGAASGSATASPTGGGGYYH